MKFVKTIKKRTPKKEDSKDTVGPNEVKPFMSSSTLRKLLVILIVVLVSVGIGFLVGQNTKKTVVSLPTPQFLNVSPSTNQNTVDLSLFWDVWRRLEASYVDKSKLDTQKMVYGAIRGMTQALDDPYTVFLPPKENEATREDLGGSFEGIGAQLGMKNERIVVIAPLEGMPAEKAGVKSGDFVLAVDGTETYGWSVPEAVEKIRGPKGSSVKLTLLHEGDSKPEEISVTRDTIKVPTVKTEFKNDVAIIHLYQFGEQTDGQWSDAVNMVKSKCYTATSFICKGVILDVRNNPGGFLDGAVYIGSEFIPDGIVVKQEFANGKQNEFKVNRKGSLLNVPTIVLINKGSASASEIVAGALKVRNGATILGEKSFGKGSIQEREELAGGAGLHITTAKWLMPDNTWVNGTGITPDVEVKDDPETDADEQLDKAIELLSK